MVNADKEEKYVADKVQEIIDRYSGEMWDYCGVLETEIFFLPVNVPDLLRIFIVFILNHIDLYA